LGPIEEYNQKLPTPWEMPFCKFARSPFEAQIPEMS
jgi:hypothetical protein